MLVLTRKVGESIQIGDDIRMTVLSAQGQNVKIGVQAPRSVTVHRKEIYERIVEENKRAAMISAQMKTERLLEFGGVVYGSDEQEQ